MQGDRQGYLLAAMAGIAGLTAGAALTVAYQNFRGEPQCVDEESAISAEPGHERKPSRRVDRATGLPGPRGGPDEVDAEALEEEIAELEEELGRLRMESALAKGQLSHYEGDPQPWPEDVPPGFAAEAFEAAAEQAAEAVEHAELLDVDCDEFPCIAVFRSHDEGPDWHAGIHEALPDPEGYDGEVGKMVWASESRGDEGSAKLLSVAMLPEGAEEQGLHERTEFRANTLTEGLAEEVLAEEAAAE